MATRPQLIGIPAESEPIRPAQQAAWDPLWRLLLQPSSRDDTSDTTIAPNSATRGISPIEER